MLGGGRARIAHWVCPERVKRLGLETTMKDNLDVV